MNNSNRILSIDIAKGLGIILVILGHIHDQFHVDLSTIYLFICLFHVPLFFFLSGLFFRDYENLKVCFIRKVKRLYVPFVIVNLIFGVLELFRRVYMNASGLESIKLMDLLLPVFGINTVPSTLSRPSWFILVLLRTFLLYKILQIVSRNRTWFMAVISALIGICGMYFHIDVFMISQTMVALPFFCLGNVCQRIGMMNETKKSGALVAIIIIVSLPVLFLISRHQYTNIGDNIYGNMILFFFGAILGILTVACISKLLAGIPSVADILAFIGNNTMSILLWHMPVMKVIFTCANYCSIPKGIIAIIAFIAAIMVPCAMSQMYSKFKNRIWSR